MKISSKKGTTMVEVIVAFAVLMVIMAIFSQAMGLTGRMMNRSDDVLEGYRNLAGSYYLDRISPTETPVSMKFTPMKKGDVFEIEAMQRTFQNPVGALYDVVPVTE